MTKYEIINYLYENNVRGDFTIEQMAEDLVNASQKEYKRGRLDALNELKAYIREMGAYDTADTPQTDKDKVVCPNCGRSDYIRSFEKDFNIKNSEYRYKCINCNTYIKDTPQTDCGWK